MYNKISKFDVILILVLITVIALIFFIVLMNMEKKGTVKDFVEVEEYNLYFMVNNNINKFFTTINEKDNKKIYNLLDKKYIDEFEINKDNVTTYVPNYGQDISFIVNTMEYALIGENYMYYAKGDLKRESYSDLPVLVQKDVEIIMFLDTNNMAYSFYILNNEDYKELAKHIKNININKNDDNKYNGAGVIDSKNICALYLIDFIDKIQLDIEGSYKLIDQDQVKNEFNTLEKYKSFISSNINKFSTVASSCAISGEDTPIYVVYDSNNNKYEFLESSIMNYYVKFTLA